MLGCLAKRDKKQSVEQIKNGVASRVTSEHELACSTFSARPTLAGVAIVDSVFLVCTPLSAAFRYIRAFSRARLRDALMLFMRYRSVNRVELLRIFSLNLEKK